MSHVCISSLVGVASPVLELILFIFPLSTRVKKYNQIVLAQTLTSVTISQGSFSTFLPGEYLGVLVYILDHTHSCARDTLKAYLHL